MLNIVITGGAGFLGQKLAHELLQRGTLIGPDGKPQPIGRLTLFDTVAAPGPDTPRVTVVTGDIGDADTVQRLIGSDTHSVFHLAAIVSSGAEADFDGGYRVNLEGTKNVLEACRAITSINGSHVPRLVFASSVAVYGGKLPQTVTDDTPQRPTTSYGNQKLTGELMINDYSRKGFVDGRAIRLPTIMVRPGRPNKAASTWASSIIREPLSGVDATCPVRPDSPMACLSPRRTIDAFIRMHDLPAAELGVDRALLLSGIRVTAGEMAAAVERNKGNRKTGTIHWTPDAAIQKIVDGWPGATQSDRAKALGFTTDTSIDEIVQSFIADDLDSQIRSLQAG
ncbi:D-erythronate dehydrogenase [Ferrovibrio xuzhouensis]|uniref:D-erythronate dehydrogenase n=1 Tax=Ferrovibrio xuzhouensis TaxID=1576914 RepID=A0ABV7VH95_9PROT